MKSLLKYNNIISFVIFVLIWSFLSLIIENKSLFPGPFTTLQALYEFAISGILLNDIYESLYRFFISLFISSTVGIFLAIFLNKYEYINKIISPIINFLRSLPPVAIIPLIIVWLGIDDISKIFSISFAMFFPIFINTYQGLQSVNINYIREGDIIFKKYIDKIKHILLPSSINYIKTGIRLAISIGFIMVYVSELSGASKGIGYRISISSLSYRIDQMMAMLFVLGFIGYFTDYLFVKFVNKKYIWIKKI